jgi:dipeptidase E
LGDAVKYLLTSGGISNESIKQALVDLLGKPISECSALAIPTAVYSIPRGVYNAYNFITGQGRGAPMTSLGWKEIGNLELTALPSIDRKNWVPLVEQADVLLAEGGDALYLNRWMRESGLADLLPTLTNTVWAGLSAGSMVMTPRIGDEFVWSYPTGGTDETLGLVDFSIFPHLDHPDMPDNNMAAAEKWAANLDTPAYVIDDDTALKVVDGEVEVVSEGKWKLLSRSGPR